MENIVSILKKNKKPIIIVGSVLVLGAIALIIIKAKKNSAGPPLSQPTPGVSWPLKRKLGAETTPEEQIVIARLQRYLNRKISYVDTPLVVDGIFGSKTEEQVQLFLGVKTVSYKLFTELMEGK